MPGEESESNSDTGGAMLFIGVCIFIALLIWDFFGNPSRWHFALVGLLLICGSILHESQR